ncbi:MAG: pentapeptide repeat-containing protein [Candidatus Latescibacteria bacterium]|nr:pentapeptide repeat-containing protein [Candidatus Latescibacterota bacterium]
MALFALVLCLLLATPSLAATGTRDTTIAGQTYALLPIETLAEQLRQSDAPLRYRHTAFAGRLDARLAGIAQVRAPLELEEVFFLDQISFDGVVFRAPVQGTRLCFGRGLSLLGTRFEADLTLEASQWRGPFSANQARFAGRTRLENCHFSATASFIGARFDGPACSLARTRFEEGAFFEEARFAGPADFADVYFEALSSFKHSAWQARASFAGARFKDRSFFWGASFAGPVSFDESRFGSEASFNQARFASPATFRRITFVHPAHFDQVEFTSGADFARSHFKRLADFGDSQAAAPLELGAFFGGDLDLRHCRAPLVDLRVPAGPAPDSLADSSGTARIFLQDSRTDQFLVRWARVAGRLAAPDSADAQSLTPVYAFLEQQFAAQGLGADALACRSAGLEHRRRLLPWTSPEKYLLLGWRLTTGYGASLGQFFLFSAALVLGFALLYRSGRSSFRPLQGARAFSLGSCLLFSLQTFVRVGAPSWRPAGGYRWWALVQGLAGWCAWALFIAALLARMS